MANPEWENHCGRLFKPPLGFWQVIQSEFIEAMEPGFYFVVGRYGNKEDALRAAHDLEEATPSLYLPDSTETRSPSSEPRKL